MCRRFALNPQDKESLDKYPGYDPTMSLQPVTEVSKPGFLLLKENRITTVKVKQFGIYTHDKFIYNAKSETILDKVLFHDAFLNHRAVIPCSSFYEADSYKIDHCFNAKDGMMLYLAGIYLKDSFVILTCKGDENVSFYHPRMPFCLKEEDIEIYLNTDYGTELFQTLKKPDLISPDFTEQLSLF